MKLIQIIIVVFICCICTLSAKQTIKLPLYNSDENCNKEPRIWFIDAINDDTYDLLFYDGCGNNPFAFSLNIKSLYDITEIETATLTQGKVETKNFIILIFDPNSFRYTHKLYYDNLTSKAVLEDYTDNSSEQFTYEEADNYFYTQQIGSILLITKKAQIDVQSVVLCSLDGKVIANLQNVGGWSQFTFDMTYEPSGMYLLRFIATGKALTKRVIYIR